MNREQDRLELLWDDLLSQQPDKIMAAYASLEPPNQQAVLTHLQRMINETGWQPEQRRSAQVALNTITDQDK